MSYPRRQNPYKRTPPQRGHVLAATVAIIATMMRTSMASVTRIAVKRTKTVRVNSSCSELEA
eukprot:11940023-Alexandrium_andersonii.AAC.1